MKLTQPLLNTALRGLKLAKSPKANLSVLDCVRVAGNGQTVTLTMTDLDQLVTFTGELNEPTEPVTRLVPLTLLQRVAKEMPRGTVLSFAKPGQIACIAGQSTTLVPYDAPNPEEFPSAAKVDGAEIELPPAALMALQAARLVTSEDPHRRSINAVCLEPTGVVATNGRELFHANTLSLPMSGLRLVPAHKPLGLFDASLPAMLRLAGRKKSNAFTLRQGPWTWLARFVDENYPNWRAVVPPADEERTQLIFATADADYLRQIIGLIPRDPRKTPTMALVVRSQKLVALTQQGETTLTHELPSVAVTGPDAHAWFDACFLLRALDYGFGQLSLRDRMSVLVARDEHREYLFMPLNIDDDQLPENLRPPMATPTAGPTTPNEPTNQTTETQDTNMSKTSPPIAPAPVSRVVPQPAPANGQAHPSLNGTADLLLTQWQDAREAVRVALDKLDGLRGSVRNLGREYRELQKEHDALKRSVRAIQKMEV